MTAPLGPTHAPGGPAGEPRPFRRISCEEGFTTPEIVAASSALLGNIPGWASGPIAGPVVPDLLDIGEGRVARMDADGVDVQLLALAGPGVQSFDPVTAISLARAVNDRLGEAVEAYPTRLAGLATMAPQNPEASAVELERAVNSLGLRGAMINSHTHGVYLDDPSVLPIFAAAEALDVPVYIHPREPSALLAAAAVPGFNVSWGYGVEAGTNVVRLIAAGVFDRHPRLRVVTGHLGETIPFLLDRMDNRYAWETAVFGLSKLDRRPSEYVAENLFVTSSGMNYVVPVAATLRALGPHKVLFAADYPFEDQRGAVQAMDSVMEALGLPVEDRARIYEGNACAVFGLSGEA